MNDINENKTENHDIDNKWVESNNNQPENGSYEVIKNRLKKYSEILKDKLEKLNTARKEVFGSIGTSITGSERIITENNCIPRDMVPIGNSFIFGYNVHIGLKSKVEICDVFSIYDFVEGSFQKKACKILEDEQFIRDFEELYTYYKSTFFAKFTVIEPYLYMIFQTGNNPNDIKAFKWLIEENCIKYVDMRSDHEVRFVNKESIQWIRAKRENQREGIHPHVSIEDRVFIDTIGGDLTIKIEDNTSTGKGIYSEEVEDKDQSLDDAEIYYGDVGGSLVLLKIRPYKEKEYRYFVFNDKLKNVVRLDQIKDSCALLPDNHGIIFPRGYYLKSGEYKLFDVPVDTCIFEQKLESSNGEDFQYFFYNLESGLYLVYSYNIIDQIIETPIVCSGYSHFENGEMVVFRHDQEPRKNHMLQIWQTPYVGKNHVLETKNDSILYKIGNKDIVRCTADCRGIYNLIVKGESYSSIYVDIVKESLHIIDSYFWIDKSETFNLKEVLINIKESASSAVAEFEKVITIKNNTLKKISIVEEQAQKLFKETEYRNYENIEHYVEALSQLRILRGDIASLKDLRYTNLQLVEQLEEKAREKSEGFSAKCVEFLLLPEGLKSYGDRVDDHLERVSEVLKTSEGKELSEEMGRTSSDLEMLIDTVSNFKIEDPTKTTEIIDKISLICSKLNQSKAKLKSHVDELLKKESVANFHSQTKLLSQTVLNYLDVSDTVEKCEEYLTKVMVQIQDMEGKFAQFEEFVLKLTEKREEYYSAFQSKKQVILEKQNKMINALINSSDRIISGVINRVKSFNTANEINSYLATDIMIEKIRDIVGQLRKLGDNVKADEITSKLKTLKEETLRQLKDRQELYIDGNVVKFGEYRFSVNTKQIELSMVQRENTMYYHISSTDFWDKVNNEEIYQYRGLWDQTIPSENNEIYRGQYLAYKVFKASLKGEIEGLQKLSTLLYDELLKLVQKFMESRYNEAYTKGVHDVDCVNILQCLLNIHNQIDLLVYSPKARAAASIFWNYYEETRTKEMLSRRLKELGRVMECFEGDLDLSDYVPYVVEKMKDFFDSLHFIDKNIIQEGAEYLCMEIIKRDYFIISLESSEIYNQFINYLKDKGVYENFIQSTKSLKGDLEGLYYLVRQWIYSYIKTQKDFNGHDFLEETITILVCDNYSREKVIGIKTEFCVTGLLGSHPAMEKGGFSFLYTQFVDKLSHFEETTIVNFNKYQELKNRLLKEYREELKLDGFKTSVLSSFVRNRLIDKVYLPLIGANLAKQIGEAGDNKRTDLMGMLLLISPPGYGKTTLMEYIASRLGIVLVKINGPSIGNDVTSLDPAMARSSGAREELRKLNLALKMGNNVMIYIDDIQHCSPEFLQKFISLCDGQRKIEGVYNGVSQTYDLRGKKVAVVMAGNPYTESGEVFKIPDMLANRADVYNLGDMLRENEEAFMLSYIENSLTSNPVLNTISNRSTNDIYTFIEVAAKGQLEGAQFEDSYSHEEISEIISVIKKLLKVRDIVLKINMEYIASAAQSDQYRREPPFKLQGSYRNMNRIAQRVVSIMNDEELSNIILNAYENDAQTLTTGAEANMLKWKEIVGTLDEKEQYRWQEIKNMYLKNKSSGSDNKMDQAIERMDDFSHKLEGIKDALSTKNNNSMNPLVDVMTQIKDILENISK